LNPELGGFETDNIHARLILDDQSHLDQLSIILRQGNRENRGLASSSILVSREAKITVPVCQRTLPQTEIINFSRSGEKLRVTFSDTN